MNVEWLSFINRDKRSTFDPRVKNNVFKGLIKLKI